MDERILKWLYDVKLAPNFKTRGSGDGKTRRQSDGAIERRGDGETWSMGDKGRNEFENWVQILKFSNLRYNQPIPK
jgi:hypothetical protein